MARHIARSVCACLVLLLWVGLPREAAAKKKVVVLDFSGPRASKIQKTFEKAVRKEARVISQRSFTREARRVKRFRANAKGVRTVAKRLGAHAVLSGKVTRKGSKLRVEIRIREGRSGEYVGDEIIVTLRGERMTRGQERKFARELGAILREVRDPRGGESESSRSERDDREEDREEDRTRDDRDRDGRDGEDEDRSGFSGDRYDDEARDDDQERDSDSDSYGDSDDDSDGDGDPDDDSDDPGDGDAISDDLRRDLEARHRGLELEAGLSFQSRNLAFKFDAGQPTTPQGYKGAMVPGAFINLDVYPLALIQGAGRGIARNIGLTAVFDKVLIIKSNPVDSDETVPTAQSRYGFGLVYRWNIGTTPTSPTLKLSVRYNKLAFTLDETAVMAPVTLPDVSYGYLDPGAQLRFPLGQKLVAKAGGHFLIVSSAGEISELDHYGAASVSGFDFEAGLDYKLSRKVTIGLGLRYMQLGLTFDGTGAQTDRNNDSMQDVQSANDRYLGAHATAAVAW